MKLLIFAQYIEQPYIVFYLLKKVIKKVNLCKAKKIFQKNLNEYYLVSEFSILCIININSQKVNKINQIKAIKKRIFYKN